MSSFYNQNNLVEVHPLTSHSLNQEMDKNGNREDYKIFTDEIKSIKRKYISTATTEMKKSESYLEKLHEETVNNEKTENYLNAIKKIKMYQENSLEKLKRMVKERDEINKEMDECHENLLKSHQKAMELLKNNLYLKK